MPNMINTENRRKPDIVKTMQGCSVNLYFSQEDNPAVLSLSKNILTASYAKKLLSNKKSATFVDKQGAEMDNNSVDEHPHCSLKTE